MVNASVPIEQTMFVGPHRARRLTVTISKRSCGIMERAKTL